MLKNKIVIVTGAAGLLGQTFTREIVNAGGHVIMADVDLEKCNEVKERFALTFSKKKILPIDSMFLDITSSESIQKLIEEVNCRYHQIDALVNNAYPRNKNYGKKLEEVSYQSFCENVSMHLGGYFLMNQQFAEFFSRQGFGNIINIASIYGVMAPRFEMYKNTSITMPVEYAAIKSAIIHLTKYFTVYYKNSNIRFNCISPGGILNNQEQPFLDAYNSHCSSKGMLDPIDICGTLKFLISDSGKCINGQNIIVDDGFTL